MTVALALGAVAAQLHQLQRGDDRRQRVAQLVAEHREELVLGAVRALGGAPEIFELLPRPHLIGDVGGDDEHARDLAVGATKRRVDEVEVVGFRSPVLALEHERRFAPFLSYSGRVDAAQQRLEQLALRLGQHLEQRPAGDRILRAVPGAARPLVGELDDEPRSTQHGDE